MEPKTVKEEIQNVMFRKPVPKTPYNGGWETVLPRELTDHQLITKIRYHMKQVLACVYELDKRGVPVCEHLNRYKSAPSTTIDYKSCAISVRGANKLKFFLKLDRRK